MELRSARLTLRPWRPGDEADLVREANDRRVWLNLRDRFPHPYTRVHAEEWIAAVGGVDPPLNLAIVVEGRPVGNVGAERQGDVCRYSAEVGYWLGAAYWGRGYASEALAAFVDYLFATFDLERLEAWTFTTNVASARVLEKCGFTLEARCRRSVFKDGQFLDSLMFARLRSPSDRALTPPPPRA